MITNAKCQRVDGDAIGFAEFNPGHRIDIPQHQRDDSYDLGLEDRDRFFLTDHVLCQPYPKPEADDATD